MINQVIIGTPTKVKADLAAITSGNTAENAALQAKLTEINADIDAVTTAPNTFNGVQVRVAINIPSSGSISKLSSVQGLNLAI